MNSGKILSGIKTLRSMQSRPLHRMPKDLIVAGVCSIVALIGCSIIAHSKQALAFYELYDSGHYLETCRLLTLFLHKAIYGGPGCDVTQLVQHIMLDGPILPLISSCAFLILNKLPGGGDWFIFAGIQCFLQAASAALVSLIAKECTGSRKWALFSGLAWALYPSALLATRVLMTETLTVVLLLLQVYLLSKAIKGNDPSKQVATTIWSGFFSGLILLIKPVLLAAFALVDLVALFQMVGIRKRILAVLTIVLGMSFAIVPWMIFTKTCLGQVYFTPQRQPVFNLIKGCDIEADGFGSFPDTASSRMYKQSDGVANVFLAIATAKPAELISLTGRKVARLFNLPWNDFRSKVFGLSPQSQVHWHRFIWLLAILGMLAILAGVRSQIRPRGSTVFVGEACCAIVLGHFCYAIFEGLPRYGFTAVPFAVILACYFLHKLEEGKAVWRQVALLGVSLVMVLISIDIDLIPYVLLLSDDMGNAMWLGVIGQWLIISWSAWLAWRIIKRIIPDGRGHALLAACLITISGAICLLMTAQKFHPSVTREWRCIVKPNMVASRELWLDDHQKTKPDFALLLIDGESDVASAKIQVNGHLLRNQPDSVYQFHPTIYQLTSVMQLQATIFGVKPESMRQWRAVLVPVEWVNMRGKNTISVSAPANGKVTLYGDYPPVRGQKRLIPSFEVFSHAKLWNSVDSLDGRLTLPMAIGEIKSHNALSINGVDTNGDLSGSSGYQIGSYRLYLALGNCRGNMVCPDLRQNSLTVASLFLDNPGMDVNAFYAGEKQDFLLDIPSTALSRSHLQIAVEGDVLNRSCAASIYPVTFVLMAETKKGEGFLVLPGTPETVYAGRNWTHVHIQETLPTGALADGVGKVRLQIYSSANIFGKDVNANNIGFKDLKLVVSAVNKPCLIGNWVGIY